MPDQEFHLEITERFVDVRLDAPRRTRFYALAFFAGLTVIAMCALLFLPGKHGAPSIWLDLLMSDPGSSGFLIGCFLLLSFPLLMLVMTKRYVRLAFPSDETFRCDGLTLTIARARWFDVNNSRWDTFSFALAHVKKIRYRRIAYLRGYSVYGLRFIADGKTRRVLPGLKGGDAEKILLTLKALGADVPDDPPVPSKLKEV